MRKFVITSAAMTAFAALLVSAPAKAAESWGPSKVGNQCFSAAQAHGRDLGFGAWSACPQTASVAIATSKKRRHRS